MAPRMHANARAAKPAGPRCAEQTDGFRSGHLRQRLAEGGDHKALFFVRQVVVQW